MKPGSAAEKGGIVIGDRLVTVNEVRGKNNQNNSKILKY